MIELAQLGQAGKTSLLFDMFRLRNRVFKERFGWNVDTDINGLETDDFDTGSAVYLLAVRDKRVVGSFRMLSTLGTTMTHEVWPEFLRTLPMPRRADVWEVSRFAVSPVSNPKQAFEAYQITSEMFCALAEIALRTGIKQLFAIYDDRLSKVLQKIDCRPFAESDDLIIAGNPTRLGCYNIDQAMLSRLRAATGSRESLTNGLALPPALHQAAEYGVVHA